MRFATLVLALALAVSPAAAQSNPVYASFPGGAKALLYRPDNNPSPRVGVLTVHRTGDKFTAPECTELSRRGFAVLCLNTRFVNNEALVEFEKIPLDVKQGVEYLKKQGVAKVILLGTAVAARRRLCIRRWRKRVCLIARDQTS